MHKESIYKVLNHAPSRWRRCGGKRAQWPTPKSGRKGGVAGKLVADVTLSKLWCIPIWSLHNLLPCQINNGCFPISPNEYIWALGFQLFCISCLVTSDPLK